MTGNNERDGAIKALRERVFRLGAAMLSISESLDLQTVLRKVVSNARELTGARKGVIVTIDESGEPEEFVTSGFTADEHRRMLEWPDGPALFKHFRDLTDGPMREELSVYVRSLGFSSHLLPQGSFRVSPLRHHGERVGSFYLLGKVGDEEFNDEDDVILLLFSAQAAAAVVNARTYRAEQGTRANLEALIETSPVGVVVFDARTGRPASFNREAKRIVGKLLKPGRPVEELLETITCRRGDGREIALSRVPIAAALRNAETIHAEEVVLISPDGRSVTILINVTPIRSAKGADDSVVVTMQDMTSLQQLEGARTEFVSMVSHELRTPLAAIKGSTATVLSDSRSFGTAETMQFFRIIDEQADRLTNLVSDLLDVGRIEAGTLPVSPEPIDLGPLVDQARSTFVAGGDAHSVLVDLEPDMPRVMADRGRILQVLNNLLINAARHTSKSLPIRVAAQRGRTEVTISVSDEGRGIAQERLPHLFRKYGGDGGRGVGAGLGLAICRGLVEAHGGRIRVESGGIGCGARFSFTIPVSDEATAADESAPDRRGSLRDGGKRTRILVVDDDPQTLRYVRHALSGAGYAPLVTSDYADLSGIISVGKPQLVLLDLVLPGTDGIKLLETVPELADMPVIFISGYGRDETIARALDAGGEDYVLKPFSETELVARVRAALRRRAKPDPFVLGDLAIDFDRRSVTVAGSEVQLTATEYALLQMLALNAGRVSTYDSLLRRVWRVRPGGGDSRLVRAYVKRLRRKLGDSADDPAYIVNVRGVGYRIYSPSTPPAP